MVAKSSPPRAVRTSPDKIGFLGDLGSALPLGATRKQGSRKVGQTLLPFGVFQGAGLDEHLQGDHGQPGLLGKEPDQPVGQLFPHPQNSFGGCGWSLPKEPDQQSQGQDRHD